MEEHKTPPFGVDLAEDEEILDASDLLVEDRDGTPMPDAAFLQALPTPKPESEDRLERQITVQPVSELLGSTPAFTVTEPPPVARSGLKAPDPVDELDFSELMELTDGPGRPPPAPAPRAEPERVKREWVPTARTDGGPTVIEFEADSEYDEYEAPPPPPAPPGRVSFRPEPADASGEFQDIPTRNVNLAPLAEKMRDEEWTADDEPDAIELSLPPPPASAGSAPRPAPRHEPQTLEIGPEAIVALHLARAQELFQAADVEAATDAAEQAMAADVEGAVLRGEREKQSLLRIFEARIGASNRLPQVIMKQPELGKLGLDNRSAFLLDRIDGNTTVEELLDVSGVPRLEAYRTLSWLLRRGVIAML